MVYGEAIGSRPNSAMKNSAYAGSGHRQCRTSPAAVRYHRYAHEIRACVAQVRPDACRNNNLDKYGQLLGTSLRSTPRVLTKNSMQSTLAAAVTPYHVYDGISVLRTAREHMVRRYYPSVILESFGTLERYPRFPTDLMKDKTLGLRVSKPKISALVISGHFAAQSACPLYPQERTIWRVGQIGLWRLTRKYAELLGTTSREFCLQ